MADAPLSPVTGKPMVRGHRPLTLSYKEHSRTVEMPGWYDPASDEAIHTGEDMAVSDVVLKDLKIRADHLLFPGEVQRIRKKLGLSQHEAGLILGGGPRAYQKYESGEVLVSKSAASLLRLLDKHPELLDELKASASEDA
jgi:HTH-type transcriptional regulator/antitoxin MqsA